MKRIALVIAALTLVTACQTQQQKADQLAAICSDPANREPDPDSIYYAECLDVVPRSNNQLEQDWYQTAPEGN
ncbi:membrane lipoprotein lipid attachment site-containing protein [Chelatococcus reniformis]|uniref:Lipoprotein n=1 Tax=Chelatococcus reniformis TaxID=1494448 RepID=A0A916XMS0_9HYPH|nr:membrane lipoprotein lipid attachment site-containing protein [Chelatococcus reniformis]GGC83338.1 hypothetical protein GCM10010994_46530 [Chelatococcus reniformis]